MKRLTLPKLRDRDAIITAEDLIFRVYGNAHPPEAYVCDPEYAPANIFKSKEPRAYRVTRDKRVYYKFFADEGLRFVTKEFPRYMVWHPPLQQNIAGVAQDEIVRTRQPGSGLESLLRRRRTDPLLQSLRSLLNLLRQRLGLSENDFGVFGSLLHDFYNPMFSDLDLIIYGRTQLNRLRENLQGLYAERDTSIQNEFAGMKAVEGKNWKFRNYSLKDYVWHQERKRIYALFHDEKSKRTTKTEFEPVKRWEEIQDIFDPDAQIRQRGWIKLTARITDDSEAPFMPSIYAIEPTEVLRGERSDSVQRVVSYVEEFRLQARKDEVVIVEGNLEEMNTPKETFNQIALTYCPRYYEQTMKVAKHD